MDLFGVFEAEAELFGELPLGAVHVEGGVGVGERLKILGIHGGQGGDGREGSLDGRTIEGLEAV